MAVAGSNRDAAPLIRLRNVTRVFSNGEIQTQVLNGVDLDIGAGEFVAIMGASGSGKSTLMNILGCLDRPSSGTYLFAGRDVAGLSPDELAGMRRETFGFIFQSYNLLLGVSACENVEMPATYSGMPAAQRHERALQLLARLGLRERAGHRPSQLSGGQQQRVSIARALVNGGYVLLADEPTGALDSQSGREVMQLLDELSGQGLTIILITHDASVAAHAHRQIEIRDGIVVSGPGYHSVSPARPGQQQGAARYGDPAWPSEVAAGFRTAIRSLFSNLFRTVLTLLGIVIGVASVIAMLAIGNGARQEVIDRISAMGSDLLLVRPGGPNQRGGRWNIATLVPGDVDGLNELPNVRAAVAELTGSYTLRYGNEDHSAEVNATSAAFPVARQWEIDRGTFFTKDDELAYATVAVLGQTTARELFGDQDPLGEYLIINNILFQVVGVMTGRGASPMGQDQDDVVFVPYTTGSLRVFGQTFLRSVTIAVEDPRFINETQDAAHELLMARHGREDFTIRNMASLIDSVAETQNTMTVLLASIAAISLLVGGIGVMNIMLVNVTERTREIGVRMAIGARRRHILQQFLLEALVVSALGGVLGVFVGLGSAMLVGYFGTPVYFSVVPVILAFGCAFATGLVFGYLPARKAAGLDPVVALASE